MRSLRQPITESVDFLAEQALLRMAITNSRHALVKLPRRQAIKLARSLLELNHSRNALYQAYKGKVAKSSFYRFSDAFELAARQVHRDMLIGAAGPVFLTLDEVARRLRVHRADVLRIIEDGALQAVQVGDQLRVTTAALADFAEAAAPARDRLGRFTSRAGAGG